MLTDKYLHGIPSDSRIKTDGRFLKAAALTESRLNQIAKLNEMAKDRGQTLAEMALSWVLKDGIVTSVLIGASKTYADFGQYKSNRKYFIYRRRT